MTSKQTYPALTTEQQAAIQAYAKQHGRTWKTRLQQDWMRSGSRTYDGDWSHLQQLRNGFGSSWLQSFKL